MHWSPVATFDSITGSIFQIYFNSPDHGFITYANPTYGKAHRSSVLETKDSGLHWTRICTDTASNSFTSALTYYSVYATHDAIFVTGEGHLHDISELDDVLLRSQNEGKSWDTLIVAKKGSGQNIRPYVFGNRDATVFFEIYLDYSHKLLFSSSNNGADWFTDTLFYSPEKLLGGVGIYSIPHTNELLCVYGDSTDSYLIRDSSSILHSTDFGRTWEKYAQLPCGNWISGNECTLYVCNADCTTDDPFIVDTTSSTGRTDVNKIGMYYSRDRGKSWSLIPNLSFEEFDDYESRRNFCVTNSGRIYATGYTEPDYHGDNYALWTISPDSVISSYSSFALSSKRIINDSFNIIINLPIYVQHTGTLKDIDLVMHYPPQSLKYVKGLAYNGNSIDVASGQWAGRVALHFNAADLNSSHDSLFGYVSFQWTPFEFACDDVIFDSIRMEESTCYSPSSANPFKGIVGSYQTCEQSSVNIKDLESINFSLYPNPARRTVEIVVSNNEDIVQYQLFNSLGISFRNGRFRGKVFEMDVSDLPVGNYYLRLWKSKGGIPETKLLNLIK